MLCGVLIGENPEFADGLHSQIDVQATAGATVGLVIHDQAIHEKHVSRRTIAGNNKRHSVAARCARISGSSG